MEFSSGCHSARIVAGLLASGLLAFSQIAPVTRESEDRIEEINRQVSVEGNAAVMNSLLQERARLLTTLMEQNPRAAVESALPGELRQALASRVPDAGALLEEKGEWTGPLVTSIADDFAHHRSWESRVIRIQGHSVSLYTDSPPTAGCSPSATVRGIRLGQRIAAASVEVTEDANSPCSTTGEQKTAVLLLNYPSTPLTSGYTPSYVKNVFFGPAPSVSDYWRDASYGSTFASGDVFGPFTLDADYTCAQTDQILQAAIQAADSTVDFTNLSAHLFDFARGCFPVLFVGRAGATRMFRPAVAQQRELQRIGGVDRIRQYWAECLRRARRPDVDGHPRRRSSLRTSARQFHRLRYSSSRSDRHGWSSRRIRRSLLRHGFGPRAFRGAAQEYAGLAERGHRLAGR